MNDEQVELALGFHLGTPHRKPFQLPKRLICISLQRTCRRLRVGSLQIAEVTLCTRPKMSGVTTICASGAARSSVNTTDVYRPPESILTAYEFDGERIGIFNSRASTSQHISRPYKRFATLGSTTIPSGSSSTTKNIRWIDHT